MIGDPNEDRLRGFAVLTPAHRPDHDEALFDALFPLIGMATIDSPPARFQPAALPDALREVPAVILVHRDKHGLALGFYSREAIAAGPLLEAASQRADCLLVPFAIPPMLARWDRALAEMRSGWRGEQPFPVPEPSGGYQWDNRRRRRRGRRDADMGEDEELPVVAEGDDDDLGPVPGDDDAPDAADDDDDDGTVEADDEPEEADEDIELDDDELDDLLSD
jgi:hypothetical protein